MASSSDANRKRKGKARVLDDDDFDAHRFKTPFHQHFFHSNVASKPIILDTRFELEGHQYSHIHQQIELRGWKRLNKPKKKISQTIIREFYANARIDPNHEEGPRFHTFVRGRLVNFSMDRIKTIMKFKEPFDTKASFKTRMMEGNQDPEAVIRDLCVEGSVWSLVAHNNSLYLKRCDLNQTARGWHDFIIHNIMPTTNQSEVTLKRAVLIHCIMTSQKVRVEKIIVDAMMNIINKLHVSKPPLAFLNIIARLCEEMEISYLCSSPFEAVPKSRPITPAMMENVKNPPHPHHHHDQSGYDVTIMSQGYGWGQLQEDMANMSKNQTEFYDSMLAQQIAYGLRLQEMETRQKGMWQEQQQFQQDMRDYQVQQKEQFQFFQQEQDKMHKELTNHRKNFFTHMEKLHATQEEQKTKMDQMHQILRIHAMDAQVGDMYTHWGLQQTNPTLVTIPPTKIPSALRENFKAGRPVFHGMLRPWPPEGSSMAPGQTGPPAVNAPRNPNAESDEE